jgi:predicted nucleic acid-binding protein
MAASYLLDTNILLRFVRPESPEYETIRQCVGGLWVRKSNLFYTSQNLSEFWNVCTRRAEQNGFGLSIAEANARAAILESWFALAPDGAATHNEWRRIVVAENVSGVQVHDARLVAAMRVHGIENLLTLNGKDFRRFSGITVLSPDELLATL